MATYYVGADGTSSKAGATSPDSFLTYMSLATHNASTFLPGDTIIVLGNHGIFSGNLKIPSSGLTLLPINYIGHHSPIFTGDATASLQVTNRSYINVSRMIFTTIVVLVNSNSSNINIDYCIIKNTAGIGLTVTTGGSVTVRNCNIHSSGNYGVRITTAGNTINLYNNLIYGHPTMGVEIAAGNLGTADYNIIIGNTALVNTNLSFGAGYTDGGHNIVNSVPKIRHYRNDTAYFCVTCDDQGSSDYWRQVVDALPSSIKTNYFPQTAGLTAAMQADIIALHNTGRCVIGNHTQTHSPLNIATAFSITTTNAVPTCNVDVAGDLLTLATTTPGNTVTIALVGKTITDLKTAVAGKGWTITNTANVQNAFMLSSLADSAGAQAVPYSPIPDIVAPNYMYFRNEITGANNVLQSLLGFRPRTMSFPFNVSSNDSILYLLNIENMYASRIGVTGSRTLSSINRFNLYSIMNNTLKGDGTESTIRRAANHIFTWAKDGGFFVAFLAHDATEFTVQQWVWLVDELLLLGAQIITMEEAITNIIDDHATADNITYTKTYSDISDYTLLQGSAAIDSGLNVGNINDFYNNPVPRHGGVDIGAFEYKRPRFRRF